MCESTKGDFDKNWCGLFLFQHTIPAHTILPSLHEVDIYRWVGLTDLISGNIQRADYGGFCAEL